MVDTSLQVFLQQCLCWSPFLSRLLVSYLSADQKLSVVSHCHINSCMQDEPDDTRGSSVVWVLGCSSTSTGMFRILPSSCFRKAVLLQQANASSHGFGAFQFPKPWLRSVCTAKSLWSPEMLAAPLSRQIPRPYSRGKLGVGGLRGRGSHVAGFPR